MELGWGRNAACRAAGMCGLYCQERLGMPRMLVHTLKGKKVAANCRNAIPQLEYTPHVPHPASQLHGSKLWCREGQLGGVCLLGAAVRAGLGESIKGAVSPGRRPRMVQKGG
jgi:hypothetical protein